jgi:hypothetical protein
MIQLCFYSPAVDITLYYIHAGLHAAAYSRCRSYATLKCVRHEVRDPESELRFVETSEILARRHSFNKII